MEKEADPFSSIYMTQLSDGAHYLNLSKEHEAISSLKMGILFFDEIHLNIASLLGNPLLLKLSNTDDFGLLYKNGILRPLFRNGIRNDSPSSAADYAKFMKMNLTMSSLKFDDLLSHANFIDDFDPKIAWIDDSIYWSNFNLNLLGLLERKNTAKDRFDTVNNHLIRDLRYGVATGDYKFSSISSLYRHADKNYDQSRSTEIKRAAEFTAQYVNATLLSSRLSLTRRSIEYLKIITDNIDGKYAINDNDTSLSDMKSAFEVDMSLIPLLKLPISSLMIVRELDGFKRLRKILRGFRGGVRSINDISDEFSATSAQCLNDIEYISKDRSLNFNKAIREIIQRDDNNRYKMFVDYVNDRMGYFGIFSLFGIKAGVTYAAVKSTLSFLSNSIQNRNLVNHESCLPDAIYDFETGNFKMKE